MINTLSLTTARNSIVILIGMALIAALIFINSNDDVTVTGLEPVSGLDVWSSGYPAAPPLDEGTRRADTIVDATVKEFGKPFWNTDSGQRPSGSDREILRDTNFRIFTPVTLNVTEVLKGEEIGSRQVTLNRYGGQVGQDRFVTEDGPYFESGQRMVLFLRDCGTERSQIRIDQGFRYRFIDRYVIDSEEIGRGDYRSGSIPLAELLATIAEEKNNPPLSPTDC